MLFCNCTFICNALRLLQYIHSYFHDISKSAIAIFATKIAVASQFVHEMRVSTKVFTQAFYSIEKNELSKKWVAKLKKEFSIE